MAFNYGELDRIRTEIDQNDLAELNTLFKKFSDLIDQQVNNKDVWYGKSSNEFKGRWEEFEETKFPLYRKNFNKEMENIVGTAKAFKTSEGI